MPKVPDFKVRSIAADQVSRCDIDAWSILESRALEPNAYLSPYFVCAAARYGQRERIPTVFLVERWVAGAGELVGVAVLRRARRSLRVPISRFTGSWTSNAFLGGVLLDREHATEGLKALLVYLRRSPIRCQVVELPRVWADDELLPLTKTVAPTVGHMPDICPGPLRAILVPGSVSAQLESKKLKSRVRDLDRRARRLGERGKIVWRCYRYEEIPEDVVESFLALEHMGWKGDAGSSLRSSVHGEAFFREMVTGFAAEKRVFFSELMLDGKTISSTCNLISGNMGFAFKIGWDPAFHSYSPGRLNELELMRHADSLLGDLACIDSGSTPDSYINQLWLDRRPLATMLIPLTLPASAALHCATSARRIMRHVRKSARFLLPNEPGRKWA